MIQVNKLLDRISLSKESNFEKSLRIFAEVKITNPYGEVVMREKFECHSFVSNFSKMLYRAMSNQTAFSLIGITGSVYTLYDGVTSDASTLFNCNAAKPGTIPQTFFGPVIGLGTTTPTVDDISIKKILGHGTLAPSGSLVSGTVSSGTITSLFVSGTPWAANAYRNCICQATSGPNNGLSKYICNNTNNQLQFYSTDRGTSENVEVFEWPNAWASGHTFNVLTYGQVVHSDSVTITAVVDNGVDTCTLAISRAFTNSRADSEDYTITEFGLIAKAGTTSTAVVNSEGRSFLIARDVISPGINLVNTFTLTLTYSLVTIL